MPGRPTTKYSLLFCNPVLAREWHPTKNGSLTPGDVSLGSNRKVWWLCSKGHAWPATVSERNQGSGCPYCSDKKVKDENSQQTENPTGASESLSTKNESLALRNIAVNSDKKVKDENSLQTVNPTLAKEWHPTKNRSLTPADVTANSHNQVWWLCSKGHEWKAAISSRNNGQGCFYCSYMQKRKR
jgi:hypothetical protein